MSRRPKQDQAQQASRKEIEDSDSSSEGMWIKVRPGQNTVKSMFGKGLQVREETEVDMRRRKIMQGQGKGRESLDPSATLKEMMCTRKRRSESRGLEQRYRDERSAKRRREKSPRGQPRHDTPETMCRDRRSATSSDTEEPVENQSLPRQLLLTSQHPLYLPLLFQTQF